MTVSVADVATELARPTPDSPTFEQWQSWILRAYRLIENRLGVAAYAALDMQALDDVVLMAVAEHVRAWRETTANRYTVAVDDASTTTSYERAAGLLEIPDNLWPMLGTEGVAESFTIGP